MVARDLLFDDRARARLLAGVDLLADTVRITLGPAARHVLIARRHHAARISRAGYEVAKEIELADPFAEMGVRTLREVAARTDFEVGDGTTTAMVLARAMIRGGLRAVAAGLNPMDVRRGIELACEAAVVDLAARSRAVGSEAELTRLATVAAGGDAELGGLLARALTRVGREGFVAVEEAKGVATEVEVTHGMHFDRGFLSAHFVTDPERMQVELERPYLLLHRAKLTGLRPLVPVLEGFARTDKSLLVIAEDVEGEALATLVVNRRDGGLKVAAIRAPGFGERRNAMLEDIAVLTGGHVVADQTGLALDRFKPHMLGTADGAVITRGATTIIGGGGDPEALELRRRLLRADIERERYLSYDREQLQQRLARLVGGVAVLRVGGVTEAEANERRERAHHAAKAARAALQEGVVPGGGVALLRAARALDRLEVADRGRRAGVRAVALALGAPARRIAGNAGFDGALVAARIALSDDPAFGFDAEARTYRDLVAAGVVDPTRVVRAALQAAASAAALLVTAEAAVVERRSA